jgi:hypothetical protein
MNGHSGYLRQNDSAIAGGSSGLRSVGRDGDAIYLKDYPSAKGLEAGNRTKISTREDKSWVDGAGDSGSEEGILPYQGVGIVRTTEFTVKKILPFFIVRFGCLYCQNISPDSSLFSILSWFLVASFPAT